MPNDRSGQTAVVMATITKLRPAKPDLGHDDELETARRRRFFRSLGKWSPTVIDAVAKGDMHSVDSSWWVNSADGGRGRVTINRQMIGRRSSA